MKNKKNRFNWRNNIISFVAIILCLFHLCTVFAGILPSPQQKAVHVSLTFILIFLSIPIKKNFQDNKLGNILNFLLTVACLVFGIYIFFFWRRFLPMLIGYPELSEKIIAVLAIIVTLEAGRRTVGLIFPLLTFFILVYAFLGHFIPGNWGHPLFTFNGVLKNIFFTADTMWGFLTGISATYLALFIMFGSFLLKTGTGQTFIDIAKVVTGKFVGGPAKVAVLSSAFFAMISGSGMANVATTGNFTIPLMKSLGYEPEFAGAVEAVASSGGAITPPVMGSSAFIMAEFLGISYFAVCKAAAIPAFYYYLAIFIGVHLQSVKMGLKPIPKEAIPLKSEIFVLSKILNLSIPIIILLALLFKGFSLTFVGGMTCMSSLLLYFFSGFSLNKSKIKMKCISMLEMLKSGGLSLMGVVPILVCSNMLLGLFDFTGLSIKFSNLVMLVGNESQLMSIIMTAILVIILGSSLPAVAAYIIGVTAAMPLLTRWGFTPLAAHLFIYHFSIIGLITPPVCQSIFVAALIAKSNWLKTAYIAMKLVPVIYVIPFIFIYDNSYILIGTKYHIFYNIILASLGIIFLESGIMGWLLIRCNTFERILLIVFGMFLILPLNNLDNISILILLFILIRQYLIKRKKLNYLYQNEHP